MQFENLLQVDFFLILLGFFTDYWRWIPKYMCDLSCVLVDFFLEGADIWMAIKKMEVVRIMSLLLVASVATLYSYV